MSPPKRPTTSAHVDGGVAVRSIGPVQRAVRDLPPDEEYAQYEIQNRKNDRNSSTCDFLEALGLSAACILAEQPIGLMGTTAAAIGAGNEVLEAKKDITHMERHNAQAQERKNRVRDQRLLNH
ncbi:MAG: hypothetical protein ACOYKZ_07515 [Chlamydiia bacterium]